MPMTLTIGVSICLIKSLNENNNLKLELVSTQWELTHTKQNLKDQLSGTLSEEKAAEILFMMNRKPTSGYLNGINASLKEMNDAINKMPLPPFPNYIKEGSCKPKVPK